MTLYEEVKKIIDSETEGYTPEERKVWLNDLQNHGCISGMVGALIYYTNTIAFYKRHEEEIDGMVKEICENTGCNPAELFKNWDEEDFFAKEQNNQNILAWFGFEETAFRMIEEEEDS